MNERNDEYYLRKKNRELSVKNKELAERYEEVNSALLDMIASAADESDTVIPNKAYITEKESGRVFNVDFSNGSTISTDIKDEKDTVKLNIELAATLCLLKKYMELSFGVEITDEGLQKILVSEIGEDFFKNIK